MNQLGVTSMCLVVGCQEADIGPAPTEPLGKLSSALESAIDVNGNLYLAARSMNSSKLYTHGSLRRVERDISLVSGS